MQMFNMKIPERYITILDAINGFNRSARISARTLLTEKKVLHCNRVPQNEKKRRKIKL